MLPGCLSETFYSSRLNRLNLSLRPIVVTIPFIRLPD